ncbi:MAG: RidA family protein, partial [Nitrospiraceae bacterium]
MAIKIERFQPEGMNVRTSAGQPSYSHVVTVSGTGKIIFIAGQLARDIDGNCVGKGDMRAQMEQTFQNLDKCLRAAGSNSLRGSQRGRGVGTSFSGLPHLIIKRRWRRIGLRYCTTS